MSNNLSESLDKQLNIYLHGDGDKHAPDIQSEDTAMTDNLEKTTASESLHIRVASVHDEAADVRSYDLRAEGNGALPRFTAGAHIDLHLPNGMIRSYSLCNAPSERDRYVIAVQKDSMGRGGSRFIYDEMQVGQKLQISAPRNNFMLAEDASHTVMIAGGIGITPFRSMVSRLEELGRSWELYYCVRNRDRAAFINEWGTHSGINRVRLNVDQEPGGRMLDLAEVIRGASPQAHFYCCGPLPMLAEFERVTESIPQHQVHLEYFNAKQPVLSEGEFEVELSRTGQVIQIKAGQSILDAVIELGIDVPYACSEGVCGSCETVVLAGTPDHQDSVLSPDEQSEGNKMMICCSRAKSERLVLDL